MSHRYILFMLCLLVFFINSAQDPAATCSNSPEVVKWNGKLQEAVTRQFGQLEATCLTFATGKCFIENGYTENDVYESLQMAIDSYPVHLSRSKEYGDTPSECGSLYEWAKSAVYDRGSNTSVQKEGVPKQSAPSSINSYNQREAEKVERTKQVVTTYAALANQGLSLLSQVDGDFDGEKDSNGLRTGEGVLKNEDRGILYEGEFKDGQFHGNGKLDLRRAEKPLPLTMDEYLYGRYEGVFANGRFSSGNAQFNHTKFKSFSGSTNGQGEMIFRSGKQYKGEFDATVDRLINIEGRGKEYYPDGQIFYDGEWKNNLRDGVGKSYDSDGNLEYEGDWKKGKKHGKGKLYKDGELVYDGKFRLNMPNDFTIDFDQIEVAYEYQEIAKEVEGSLIGSMEELITAYLEVHVNEDAFNEALSLAEENYHLEFRSNKFGFNYLSAAYQADAMSVKSAIKKYYKAKEQWESIPGTHYLIPELVYEACGFKFIGIRKFQGNPCYVIKSNNMPYYTHLFTMPLLQKHAYQKTQNAEFFIYYDLESLEKVGVLAQTNNSTWRRLFFFHGELLGDQIPIPIEIALHNDRGGVERYSFDWYRNASFYNKYPPIEGE